MTKMMAIFLTTPFLLYSSIPLVDPNKTKTALVTVCPKNQTEVIEAATKLGCDNDKYGNSRYLCLPKKEKTSLVELCVDGVMGIQEKGICLELYEGELIHHSCKSFSSGCPESHFFDYDFYKYPACQNINTESRCYVLDPICSSKPHIEEPSSPDTIVYVFGILGPLFFFVVCFVLCYCCRKKRQNKSKKKNKRRFFSESTFTIPLRSIRASAEAKHVKEIRMVLLGKKGAAKSATGNTILGMTFFESSALESSIRKCITKSSYRFGHKIVIVDTPGIFDPSCTNEQTQEEICKSIGITDPGPNAFILVFSMSMFTEEDRNSVQHFVKYFGEKIYEYAVVLFTCEDDLQVSKSTFMSFINKSPPELKELIKKCGQRVIAFNNRITGKKQEAQVEKLFYLILENIKQKRLKYYKAEMYAAATKSLKKDTERKDTETIDETEKERIQKKIRTYRRPAIVRKAGKKSILLIKD